MRSVICRYAILSLFAGAVFSAACSEPAPPVAPTPTPKSADARVQFYKDCWEAFNTQAWDKFGPCYADNAVSETIDGMPPSVSGRAAIIQRGKDEASAFPDRRGEVRLILANGEHLASVAMYTATNTGSMPGPDGKPAPPTGKAIGMLMAHTVEMDPTGSFAVSDAAYIDQGTMMAQLGVSQAPARKAEKATGAMATVVIAKNDDTERANLAAAQAEIADFNKHDIAAISATAAPDYKFIEIPRPADANLKEMTAGLKEMFAAFSDITITPSAVWAAGDYVVVTGALSGTNTGDMPSMKMKKTGKSVTTHFIEIFKYSGGKVQEDWLFYNGAAFAAQLGMK